MSAKRMFCLACGESGPIKDVKYTPQLRLLAPDLALAFCEKCQARRTHRIIGALAPEAPAKKKGWHRL